MSAKTKAKRAAKEAKRLPSAYRSPVAFKLREAQWYRYRKYGIRYAG